MSFKAAGEATWVGLELVYEIKARTIVTPLTDLLFIRRAQRESLARTLLRFRRELDPAAGQIA